MVPGGFCITTAAYEQFVTENGLAACIAMELGRKSLENMRWEELWDAAVRIRSEFLRAEIPRSISEEIRRALAEHAGERAVAVRSSAPGEDSRQMSFAGLHESVVGPQGGSAVLDAVRTVWSSLWSDAALLYRRELALDPQRSRMAVLVQEVKVADCSGVAFGRDPRNLQADCVVVEAVPGQCALLVDGSVDPDRWTLQRSTGQLIEWRPGNRGQGTSASLLEQRDLATLLDAIQRVENLFAWPPDVEWTGRSASPVLLQARPITTSQPDAQDQRTWYLSLRPDMRRLTELAKRVTEQLIPELEAEGGRFAAEELPPLRRRSAGRSHPQTVRVVATLEEDLLGRIHPVCPWRPPAWPLLQRRSATGRSLRVRRAAQVGRHARLAAKPSHGRPRYEAAREPAAQGCPL